jgi:hypothetical protein
MSHGPRGLAWLAVPSCLAAAACHAPASSDRLEGRWSGVRAEGVSAEAVARATAFATSTELEFRRNEITVTTSKETQSGRYQLVREDPSSVVIATDLDGPAHPQTFVFAGDESMGEMMAETMRWVLPEGKAIVFVKE